MQIRDRELTYIFQNGKPVELREGSKSLIKLNTDPSTGKVNGLTLEGNKMVKLERTQRPIVQIVNGQAMIGGVMDTLGGIATVDGKKTTFEYGVDSKMNPTMTMGDRVIAWDSNLRILKDGEWNYQVKVFPGDYANAAIGRTDANGRSGYWHLDTSLGRETTTSLDGVQTVTQKFVSGKLANRTREITRKKGDKLLSQTKYIYDDASRVIREISFDAQSGTSILERRYTAGQKLPFETTKKINDVLVWKQTTAFPGSSTNKDNKPKTEITRFDGNGAVIYSLTTNQ